MSCSSKEKLMKGIARVQGVAAEKIQVADCCG
jgi:hypothetical protein